MKSAAKTWWGKMLLGVFCIVLLPLGIYLIIKENIAIFKAKKALAELAKINKNFRWTVLNERTQSVVRQVYRAWNKGDIELAQEWMTAWYWQNQKLTVLEEWESAGLVNYCKLNKINYIKPLYVEYVESDACDGEGSRIVLLVQVNLQDYLISKETGTIIEGDKRNKKHESVWTLLMQDGQWKLTMIEDNYLSLQYIKMKNDLRLAYRHLDRPTNEQS